MNPYERIIKYFGDNWITAVILVIAVGLIALPKVRDGLTVLISWFGILKKSKPIIIRIHKWFRKTIPPPPPILTPDRRPLPLPPPVPSPPLPKPKKICAVITTWENDVSKLRMPGLNYFYGSSPSKDEKRIKIKKGALNLTIEWQDISRIIFSKEHESQAFTIKVYFNDGRRDDFTMSDQSYGIDGVLNGESDYGPTNIKLKDIQVIEVSQKGV